MRVVLRSRHSASGARRVVFRHLVSAVSPLISLLVSFSRVRPTGREVRPTGREVRPTGREVRPTGREAEAARGGYSLCYGTDTLLAVFTETTAPYPAE